MYNSALLYSDYLDSIARKHAILIANLMRMGQIAVASLQRLGNIWIMSLKPIGKLGIQRVKVAVKHVLVSDILDKILWDGLSIA